MIAAKHFAAAPTPPDRKSTRLNSSHTEIYTLSLHDALPICLAAYTSLATLEIEDHRPQAAIDDCREALRRRPDSARSEEHTSELQSHRDLHSFPTRRSSDLPGRLHQSGHIGDRRPSSAGGDR